MKVLLNTCESCQFHTPTECPGCNRVLIIPHSCLKTTSFSRLHSVSLTPTRLQKVISSARPRSRAHASVQHPLDADTGLQDAKEAPPMLAVFLPFAWAGSILRRKLHRLLQRRCLKRENVMPPSMENCLSNNLTRDTFITKKRVMRCTKTQSGQTLLPRRIGFRFEI